MHSHMLRFVSSLQCILPSLVVVVVVFSAATEVNGEMIFTDFPVDAELFSSSPGDS